MRPRNDVWTNHPVDGVADRYLSGSGTGLCESGRRRGRGEPDFVDDVAPFSEEWV